MPNGQSILVKCEVKSRGGDVFDMIVAHSNLVEHFYFGLAYIDGKQNSNPLGKTCANQKPVVYDTVV